MRALIFDLDGTLIDTVYAHVFAWQRALREAGMPIDGWRIHRRIGMSGGLFTPAVSRGVGGGLSGEGGGHPPRPAGGIFPALPPPRRPPPRAVPLPPPLRRMSLPYPISTSRR